ncbi:MAG: hypothetical protein Q9167_003216 [Letrouitia subvulpina]
MTSHSGRSPRAAIRDWLSRTIDETVEQPDLEVAQNNEAEKPARNVKHKAWRQKDRSHQNCPQSSANPRLKQDINYEKLHTSPGRAADFQDHRRLADRLGLRAPFRDFPTQERQSEIGLSKPDRKRKRKLSTLSSSSYLEPAVSPEIEDLSSSTKFGSTLTLHRPEYQQNFQSNSSLSNAVIVSLEKPKETYERKRRHKTREDRYELKQDKKTQKEAEARKKTANKKKEKHKRRTVSGTALMQDFFAKNVGPSRLTV